MVLRAIKKLGQTELSLKMASPFRTPLFRSFAEQADAAVAVAAVRVREADAAVTACRTKEEEARARTQEALKKRADAADEVRTAARPHGPSAHAVRAAPVLRAWAAAPRSFEILRIG